MTNYRTLFSLSKGILNSAPLMTKKSTTVQCLGDQSKPCDVLNYLNIKKCNIYYIQDTHFVDKDIPYIRSMWVFERYSAILTHNIGM